MEPDIKEALDRGGIVDITTTGRTSGLPRRIEIYMHQIDGAYYLTGRPGPRRDWERNIEAEPKFTVHLKHGITADVDVVGETEPDREERARVILAARVDNWGADPDQARDELDLWLDRAPYIRFRPV